MASALDLLLSRQAAAAGVGIGTRRNQVLPAPPPPDADEDEVAIEVDGAVPGDAVKITLLGFKPCGWGWTANIPGFGLLVMDLMGRAPAAQSPWQTRLSGLLRKHDAQLCVLSDSQAAAPSLGAMVALRLEPQRQRDEEAGERADQRHPAHRARVRIPAERQQQHAAGDRQPDGQAEQTHVLVLRPVRYLPPR